MAEFGECLKTMLRSFGAKRRRGNGLVWEHHYLKSWVISILICIANWVSANASGAVQHYVFAHYMVCYATYGDFGSDTNSTIAGYKREIQEAQAAGIDGFALNLNAYDDPTQSYYNRRVAAMYNAAEQLNSGFKLFFSVDYFGDSNVVDMVSTYANRSPTFRYQGKIVLSAYGHNDVPSAGWSSVGWTNVIAQLQTNGYPIFFIPYFFSDPVMELPTYENGKSILDKYGGLLDGLFYWGAGGLPPQLADSNSNYDRATHEVGKVYMASVAPTYWGNTQTTLGRRYYEFDGGEGIAMEWESIITNQPDWVEICTWNDFNESTYVSPVDDLSKCFGGVPKPYRYSHAGYLELSKRYIQWFKSDSQPPIQRDAMFYFYRTHPKDLASSNTNEVRVWWRTGNVQDTLNTTLLLTAPAELVIQSGTLVTTNTVAAGMQQLRTPFAPGPQTLTLRRNGRDVISLQGPPILSQIDAYDFFTASGFGYDLRPPPPSNLRILKN